MYKEHLSDHKKIKMYEIDMIKVYKKYQSVQNLADKLGLSDTCIYNWNYRGGISERLVIKYDLWNILKENDE